jgi:hypothetical protein
VLEEKLGVQVQVHAQLLGCVVAHLEGPAQEPISTASNAC